MKVLKTDKISNTEWKKKIVCASEHNGTLGCGSRLEICREDIYEVRTYDPVDGHDTYYFTQCPVCKKTIGINIGDIPYGLRDFPDKKEWIKKQNRQITMKPINKQMKPQEISLRDIKDFPKKGGTFKDISPLLANPKEMKRLMSYLACYWKRKIDKIGGFDARGFIFGSTLAYEMDLPFFMLRKAGKLPGACKMVLYDLEYGSATLEVRDDAVKQNERILLIDDLLATGGTAYAGCQLVETLGGKVTGVQFLIELKHLPGRKLLEKYDVQSILQV